jgi:two-component system chemotaxis sensor kinase CheA
MNDQERDFLRKLQTAFCGEARDHLQAISSGLIELEHCPDDARRKEIILTVFRESHSLKGASRAVNRSDIESICQAIEGVFAGWRGEDVHPPAKVLDRLHQAINVMETAIESGSAEAPGWHDEGTLELIDQLSGRTADASTGQPRAEPAAGEGLCGVSSPDEQAHESPREAEPPAAPLPAKATPLKPAARPSPAASASLSDTLRIPTAKLDSLFLQAEELLALKLMANQRVADLRGVQQTVEAWEKQWTEAAGETADTLPGIESDGGRGRGLPEADSRPAALVDINRARLREVTLQLTSLVAVLDQDRRVTAGMVDRLLEDAKKLLMLPFSTLLEVFPKLVRDLSRDQGKEVDLVIRGTEVEVDKRILEEMKDPLIHLLRNCVDHGIESPESRALAGKPPRGTITLGISQVHGNKVEICIVDDGQGIDPQAVKAAALRRGLLDEDRAQELSDAEALNLVFRAEVSTSRILTEISGRGLGLAIVKEKVDKVGGRIEIETRRMEGTTFHLILPLTLATFKAVLVEAGGQVAAVPTANAEHVYRIRPEDVVTVENLQTLRFEDQVIPLVRLDDVLELPRQDDPQGSHVPVLVLNDGIQRIAFRLGAVLGEQEVLLKRLGKPLLRVRNVAGATVLGSGKAVPVLNAADLLKSAVKGSARAAAAAAGNGAVAGGKTKARAAKSLLVVEDSVTARMLIKGILDSAGYRVKTAVDGLDAWTALKTDDFDLVVSDVEMPRMDGFALTAQIRADRRLADLPVVLVTALASRQDRERGVEAGANAYIVKSSFDQSNLLDVVARLL